VVLFSHGVSIGCTVETVTDEFSAQNTTVRVACTRPKNLRFAPTPDRMGPLIRGDRAYGIVLKHE
jgi:hypothetical protein